MTRDSSEDKAASKPRALMGDWGSENLFRLVRYSHIFSSTVREVLEWKLLQKVTTLPLSLSQFHLLRLMSFNGVHQVGQVADFLGVSPPAATKNVDKLERLKLLVRSPSEGDRRATLLSVSPKGRRLVRKYEEMKAARLTPVLEEFGTEEIDQLSTLLERFSVSLLKLEDPGDSFCLRCSAYIQEGCPVGEVHNGCPYQKGRSQRANRGATRGGS